MEEWGAGALKDRYISKHHKLKTFIIRINNCDTVIIQSQRVKVDFDTVLIRLAGTG